ncbi:hypothetical protein TNCV_2995591 [Trichonephila clavipes]|nr:hypothetical protein TNCV_2995591 [Trichonephila clavipes]
MDACKYIVPSRHEGTLNSRRDASPLVRLVEGEERWEAPDHPRVFSLKLEMERNKIVQSPFGLAIHQNDHQARRRFVEWAQNEIAVVPDFHKRILLSDEAHFWLNGYVNKQNCHIWSEANPQVYVETPLHPEKLTVWTCELASKSCDLTPLDCFLWVYVKSLVYADKPQTLDYLEDNIRRVIADIRPQMLEKVIIGRPDWTTSEPAVAVICQKSYLKCNATRLSLQ